MEQKTIGFKFFIAGIFLLLMIGAGVKWSSSRTKSKKIIVNVPVNTWSGFTPSQFLMVDFSQGGDAIILSKHKF